MLKNTLMLAVFLVACGDNIKPDNRPDRPFPPDISVDVDDLGDGQCPAWERGVECPDAAVVVTPDAAEELDEDTKAACCHALLDGQPPKHECGYPPGLCKNGKKTLFCKNDHQDAQFELCNP